MYQKRKDLHRFSRILREYIFKHDTNPRKFIDEIGYKYELKLGAFVRYYYAQNAPSIQILWKLSYSLSELQKENPEDIFMRLSLALKDVTDKR